MGLIGSLSGPLEPSVGLMGSSVGLMGSLWGLFGFFGERDGPLSGVEIAKMLILGTHLAEEGQMGPQNVHCP